jgi:hypothetical protein
VIQDIIRMREKCQYANQRKAVGRHLGIRIPKGLFAG